MSSFFLSAEEFSLNQDSLKNVNLDEIVVQANPQSILPSISVTTLSVAKIDRNFFQKYNSANFVKTLTKLPGLSAMDIGNGFSKPVIRGFGFNRMAVVDRGIVVQNQQWGSDHGLEIDQYEVENVLIHKGSMSLFFGSDAMGGVIEICPLSLPLSDGFHGDVTLLAKSNNGLLGSSVRLNWKKGGWFLNGRVTVQQFGDYRIPADSIDYLTWKMPVYKGRMKNTAGYEYHLSLSGNYSGKNVNWWWNVSDIEGKTGFFPGAHGLPDLKRLDPDKSSRNVEKPYTLSNHFKFISNFSYDKEHFRLRFDVGYQRNDRKELSLFHTHYSNQQLPDREPDLELAFLLQTLSGNMRMEWGRKNAWRHIIGFSTEYQQNNLRGYAFLLPEFQRYSGGIYFLSYLPLKNNLTLLLGVRCDVSFLHVKEFYDPILAEYLIKMQFTDSDQRKYAQRAVPLRRFFPNLSGSFGFIYDPPEPYSIKVNIGRNFRFPTANELSVNGVHHGAFRHEQGNTSLKTETNWQLDAEVRYEPKSFLLAFTPFFSYFPNFLYLNPTGMWSMLPHSGQIYRYAETSALMFGGELETSIKFGKEWSIGTALSFVYEQNLKTGYPLPFSSPATLKSFLMYEGSPSKIVYRYSFRLENEVVFRQNRISTNEQSTPSAVLFHLSAHAFWNFKKMRFSTDLQLRNILNTLYLNHLSFYRKINAPEPGRNFQFMIRFLF